MNARRFWQQVPPHPRGNQRRHVGETLPFIVLQDPLWFFFNHFVRWSLYERGEVGAKARTIIVPEGKEVLYEGLSRRVRLVSEGFEARGLDAVRPFLDLSLAVVPNGRRGRRKVAEELRRLFKCVVLGSSSSRITKKRAEEFFANDGNFAAYREPHPRLRHRSATAGTWTTPSSAERRNSRRAAP